MSEIRVTTLKDTGGGNSSTTAEIYSGRAKAWVNFNGTSTVAIRASFNVNTVGDNGTGDYTVNFTTALADANYSWALSRQYESGVSGIPIVVKTEGGTITTTAFRLSVSNGTSNSAGDSSFVTANFFR